MKNPEFTPPVKPCLWNVFSLVNGRLYIRVVGPAKTAYEAWRMSKLDGGFGSFRYSINGEA